MHGHRIFRRSGGRPDRGGGFVGRMFRRIPRPTKAGRQGHAPANSPPPPDGGEVTPMEKAPAAARDRCRETGGSLAFAHHQKQEPGSPVASAETISASASRPS